LIYYIIESISEKYKYQYKNEKYSYIINKNIISKPKKKIKK